MFFLCLFNFTFVIQDERNHLKLSLCYKRIKIFNKYNQSSTILHFTNQITLIYLIIRTSYNTISYFTILELISLIVKLF